MTKHSWDRRRTQVIEEYAEKKERSRWAYATIKANSLILNELDHRGVALLESALPKTFNNNRDSEWEERLFSWEDLNKEDKI